MWRISPRASMKSSIMFGLILFQLISTSVKFLEPYIRWESFLRHISSLIPALTRDNFLIVLFYIKTSSSLPVTTDEIRPQCTSLNSSKWCGIGFVTIIGFIASKHPIENSFLMYTNDFTSSKLYRVDIISAPASSKIPFCSSITRLKLISPLVTDYFKLSHISLLSW